MSVLRRAKLRTPDGTESIEYPLGVEAKNVEVANQENLSQRLVRIDEDLEKNEEDIAAVSELAGTNKQNIGANEIRIDALERRSVSIEQKPYYFNTVADMKAYQELKVGDMTVTLGYYSANDGGSGTYQIVNDTSLVDDGGSVHDIINGLKAKLVINNNTANVKQFGAKGDGITDDRIFISNAINKVKSILFSNNSYYISEEINIASDTNLIGNDTKFIIPSFDASNSDVSEMAIFRVLQNVKCSAEGIEFISTNDKVPGIYIKAGDTTNYRLSNRYSVRGINANLYIRDCIFTNIYGVSNVNGDIKIENCSGSGVGMFAYINKGTLISRNNKIKMAPSDMYYHIYYINVDGKVYSYNNNFKTDILFDIYHPTTSLASNPYLYANGDICIGKYLNIIQGRDGECEFNNCIFDTDFTSENIDNNSVALYKLTNMKALFKNCKIREYCNYQVVNSSDDITFENTSITTLNALASWLGSTGVYKNCTFETPGAFSSAGDTAKYYNCNIKCNLLVTTSTGTPASEYYNCFIESYTGSSNYAIGVTSGQLLKFINNLFKGFSVIKTSGTNVNQSYYINNNLI